MTQFLYFAAGVGVGAIAGGLLAAARTLRESRDRAAALVRCVRLRERRQRLQ